MTNARKWYAQRNRHGVRGFYRDQWWTQLNIGGWEVGYCRRKPELDRQESISEGPGTV